MKTVDLAICLVLASAIPALSADDSSAPPKSQRVRDPGLPQISVIDKLLAIEAALGPALKRYSEDQWAKSYEDLFHRFMRDGELTSITGEGSKEIYTALALGIKASDAVLALKARKVEELNDSARQIEQLALKLGASKKELGMADTVKRYANAGRWLDAFLALGYLQRSVLNYLREHGEKKDQAVLVIVGGWLQGGRCVTSVIDENYGDTVSNILREPRLVDMIKEELDNMRPEYINDPLVSKISNMLKEIHAKVNVGFKEPVTHENVKALHKMFDDLVVEIAPKGAASAPAKP